MATIPEVPDFHKHAMKHLGEYTIFKGGFQRGAAPWKRNLPEDVIEGEFWIWRSSLTDIPRTLFCGLSVSPQSWYRCGLPANQLEQDWAGIIRGAPGGEGIIVGGNIPDEVINIDDYEVIITQIVGGEDWEKFIKECQARGQKVLYEVDDFIHGVHKCKGHFNAGTWNRNEVKKFQRCMNLADGMICSTEFLSEQYKKYNENQFVCKNSLDTWRYNVEKPETDEIVIGWSGGTGHDTSMVPPLRAIYQLMQIDDRVRFVCAGEGYANAINEIVPGNRGTTIPWTTLENYPFVISQFDIAIAPGHESKYIKSKSELRYLEASAGEIPVIGDPRVYHSIVDGETGLHAQTEEEWLDNLIWLTDAEKGKSRREGIAKAAKEYVVRNNDIVFGAKQWEDVLLEVCK